MDGQLAALTRELSRNLRDLVPILLLVGVFQGLVAREPMPELERRLIGAVMTLIGLTYFVRGLDMSIITDAYP